MACRVALFALLLALGLALQSSAPAAPVPKHLMPKEQPFAFPTTVGTTWVYVDGNNTESTIRISAVEEKDGAKHVITEYVYADGTRPHHMTRAVSDQGVFLVAEHGGKYSEPWCVFKLPHKQGQRWETGHGLRTSGPVETVKVPAGEFVAARVDWQMDETRVARYWYAHGVGVVFTDGGGSIWKLKQFTPGKQ